MRVLITGAGGQLAWELERSAPPGVVLTPLSQQALDITDAAAVTARVGELRPAVIINAAAHTAVDRAESEPAVATAVNAHGVGHLARAAKAHGARLVQVSTDFVFDGQRATPYPPDHPTAPLSVYGHSKAAGEALALAEGGPETLVVRTAWLYSAHGGNFVKTMLRLMGSRDALNVVADQVGTPTWGGHLAPALWQAVARGASGIHHWSDAGVASWYDFAVAIQEEALALGLLQRAIPIHPIPTSGYPTPAQRPPYSVLDRGSLEALLGYHPPHWREGLRSMLRQWRERTDHG